MSKNILLLTGSPRRGGNSDLLADAFIQGAETADQIVERVDTARKTIKGCTACELCFSKVTACVFDDDFNELAPKLEQADVVVFATPIYWFTFPMSLKAVIDKFHAFLVGKKETIKNKKCVLLACGADGDEAFAGIVKSFELITAYLQWEHKGVLIVPNVLEKGDVLKTDLLKQAENYGKSI